MNINPLLTTFTEFEARATAAVMRLVIRGVPGPLYLNSQGNKWFPMDVVSGGVRWAPVRVIASVGVKVQPIDLLGPYF